MTWRECVDEVSDTWRCCIGEDCDGRGERERDARRASTSSPWRFRRHRPQNAIGFPLRQLSFEQWTCGSTVFWRHQWHVTPSSESYTRPPTAYRRAADDAASAEEKRIFLRTRFSAGARLARFRGPTSSESESESNAFSALTCAA